ncbi:MAG TPA: ASPIC/UnbV domain-containing protein, partial [Rhodothermales bacterium]
SNRSAIGAEVRLFNHGALQRRMVRSGSSYLSQSELPLTFGLGAAVSIDSVVIEWPSGLRQVFADVSVNSAYRLLEGDVSLTAE